MDYFIIGLSACFVIFASEHLLQKVASKLFVAIVSSSIYENSIHALFPSNDDASETTSDCSEKGEMINAEKISDLNCVKEIIASNCLDSQLASKAASGQQLRQQVECRENSSSSSCHSATPQVPQSAQLLKNLQQNSHNDVDLYLQLSANKECSISTSSIKKPSFLDKVKIMMYEDIICFFVFVSLSFMWLGAWEVNIHIFNFGEPADAWINFVAGSACLFLFGLVSFAGVCGCAHDMPLIRFPASFSQSVSVDLHTPQ